MREMTRKLYSQYEEKLREEEQKHKLEKETLIVCGTFGAVLCLLWEHRAGFDDYSLKPAYLGRKSTLDSTGRFLGDLPTVGSSFCLAIV